MDDEIPHAIVFDADGNELGRLTPELAELIASDPLAAAAALTLAGVDPHLVELLTAPTGPRH